MNDLWAKNLSEKDLGSLSGLGLAFPTNENDGYLRQTSLEMHFKMIVLRLGVIICKENYAVCENGEELRL